MWKLKLKKIQAEYKPEIILIPLIFALDRVSKAATLKWLAPKDSVEVLPFFRLTYVENTGAAFGMFQNGNYLLAGASAAVLLLLIKWRGELIKSGASARYAVVFIIAGAIANLYDRIVLGYVVDYFDFIIWPVFNIADSFITVGAALLGFVVISDFFKREGK
jgi:signal peptidase II